MRHRRPSYRLLAAAAMIFAMGGALHAQQEALPILTRELRVQSTNVGSPLIKISAPNALGPAYNLILPPGPGQVGDVLTWSATTGALVWQAPNTSSWSLTGNATTNAWNGTAGTRLGTTSAFPLVLATTNATPQDIRFFTGVSGATERMRITGTDGYVGIGTTSPSTLLDVAGTLSAAGTVTLLSVASGDPADSVLLINSNNQVTKTTRASLFANSGWTLVGNNIGAVNATLGSAPSGPFLGTTSGNTQSLQIATNNAVRMIITSTGEITMGGTLGVSGQITGRAGVNLFGALSPLQVDGSAGTAGQVLTSTGDGLTPTWTSITGLQYFDETLHSGAPNVTVNAVRWQPKASTTNVDAVLSSRGTGALLAQVPDNTATGGNKRGASAVDWQMDRAVNTQVASGAAATIGGGSQNTASGSWSTASGGEGNTASGSWSTASGGYFNAAGLYATVSGGLLNNASSEGATVSGGGGNNATGMYTTVSGGGSNSVSGSYSTVLGGYGLTISGEGSAGFNATNATQNNVMSVSQDRTMVLGNTNLWLANNDNTARELRFYEGQNSFGTFPATGTNYTAFKAGVQSADVTYTLPTATPTVNNQVLSSTTDGTMSWSSITGLQYFTETLHTAAPNNTVNAVRWQPATGTNVDVVISPRGTGALMARVPDGTELDGNKRGEFAVDWQLGRGDAEQVASGASSTISGGQSNMASGDHTVVSGGLENLATGTRSTVSGGSFNWATGEGSSVLGGTENKARGAYSTVLGGYGLRLSGRGSIGFQAPNADPSNFMTVSAANTMVLGNVNLWLANNDDTAREIRFYEAQSTTEAFPAAGTNYTAFKAGAQSADITYTLPTTGGSSGQALTTDGSGTLSWSTVAQVSVAGTTDRVAKFTSASTIGNSRISDGSTTLTIGTENISSIEIGTAQTTGTITIGGTSGTGLISIGGGTSPSRADIEIGRNGYKWIQVGSESNVDNRVILVGRGEAAVTAYGTFSVRPTQSDNSLVAPALRLMERHQGVGTPNYVALKSPNDLTANYTLEFPANDGDANQVLTTDGSGVLSWTTPLTSATGWSLTGNTGTNATTNFLGTTDNQDVVFKRFNIEAFRITTDSLSFSTSRDVFINGVRAGRGGSGGFTGFVSNTVFGSDAMTSVFGGATAEKNSAFGRRALYAVTMGGDNTAVGFGALEFTTTGSHNTALGSGAIGLSTTGSQNVAVGWRAMYNTGASSISSSTAIGYEAGRYVNGANGLTAVGYGALSGATTTSVTGTNNTALGLQAGASVTTGSNNLFLGAASSIGTGSDNNSIVIGYNATGIGSNTVVLGNSSIVTTALRGNVLINNSGASAGQVRFLEGSAGMDYAAIQAPASLAAPYTLTLPANDGDANQVLTTDGSGTLSWTTPSTSVPLSSITAATADNTINSGNNEQEWQWNSLGQNRQGLTLSSNSTTVGGSSWRVLRVRANGSANTSATIAALEVENSTTDGGVAPVNAGAYIWASNGNVNTGAQGAGIAAIATSSNTGLLGTATSSANVTTNYGVRGTVDVTAGTNTTAYAGYFTSAPSGTGAITTNVAGYFSATGGANNYAIIVPASSGTVGIGTTAPAVSMDINGGLAVQPGAQVDITADNQLVTIGNRSSVIVSSNNSPANRTITLSNGLQTGQILYIMVTGTAAGNGVEIVDDPVGANTNLTGLAQLLGGAVMQLIWDGNDWREVSRSNN